MSYKSNHLHSALLELILELGKCAQLSGANGSEVGGVGEENGPAVADEFVEVDLALRSQGFEVGGCIGRLSSELMCKTP